jgi:tRNA-specific 2-thiouridylase
VSKNGRALVAMSGGIDSSIAAIMLHDEGYEIIGFTLKTWDYSSSGGKHKETGCCSLDSINDAREVAVKMGANHYVLDVRAEFDKLIVDDFIKEYLSGRTPNPCVLCNTYIKWGLLLQKARALDCDIIATGHYARVRREGERYILFKGVDEIKDQSYVLWGLTQEYLAKTIFPLGALTKSDIRKIAKTLGFNNLVEKKESYEICFIPDDDYRSFLNHKVEGLSGKYDGGYFVTTNGKVLGKHKGFPFYTIGQRKGLTIATGSPMYVVNIIPETNTIVLGSRDELQNTSMKVGKYNLIKYPALPADFSALTKIRYKDKGTMSKLTIDGDTINVEFNTPVNALAPGQSAVFYQGEDVIGGGFIL